MRYIRGIIDWIESLESGRQFQKWIAVFINVLAVSLFLAIGAWGVVNFLSVIEANSEMTDSAAQALVIAGAVLEACVILLTAVVLLMLLWGRARKVRELGKPASIVLMTITGIMIRLAGEVGFVGLIGIGAHVMVTAIFRLGAPKYLLRLDPEIEAVLPLSDGIVLFLLSIPVGAAALITAYFIAEKSNALTEIAMTLQRIETKLSHHTESDT